MKIAIACVCLVLSQTAFANVMNVAIDCQSASGRTLIAADVPGDDEDASIALSLDGQKVAFVNDAAQGLLNAGVANLQNRVARATLTRAEILTQETKSSYSLKALVNGQLVFALTSKGPFKLEIDRDYGYRTGQFKATLEAIHHGTPFKADLSCTYDYAP